MIILVTKVNRSVQMCGTFVHHWVVLNYHQGALVSPNLYVKIYFGYRFIYAVCSGRNITIYLRKYTVGMLAVRAMPNDVISIKMPVFVTWLSSRPVGRGVILWFVSGRRSWQFYYLITDGGTTDRGEKIKDCLGWRGECTKSSDLGQGD